MTSLIVIRGMVKRSYLADRAFSVKYGNFVSTTVRLSLVGSLKALLLTPSYSLHTCWISGFDLSFKYGMFHHVYADDTQISLPLKSVERYGCNSPLACLEEVRSWMSSFGSVKPELN